ncbi:MAG: hypothetical protein GY913_20415 [Proteobacteria bacterium]|nr:hypothetical protein [Pseudomonadota bacterium]MCP4919272.1 hypothetical protein [Pseudomonadota bacterium]
MLFALALGCAPGTVWDGSWLVKADNQSTLVGDCLDEDAPVYSGTDNGVLEVYSTGDGKLIVDMGWLILRGAGDRENMEADWEQEDAGDYDAIEISASRDGDTISGVFRQTTTRADPAYECKGSTGFTGSRLLDTSGHLD